MAFPSKYACKIWDVLYTVLIPDQLTQNPDYIRRFGTYITQDKKVDQMVSTNFTTVKITIAKILEYYIDGIEIQIPSREDMIQMHKDIELYLAEWKDHIKYDINLDVQQNKELILSLEKLSKYIYNKANPREVIDNLFINKKIGLINPIQQHVEQTKEVIKPDYDGIASLVRSKTNKSSGRF